MVSSITQDPYSIIISLNLASSVNLNIGAPPRPTELIFWARGCCTCRARGEQARAGVVLQLTVDLQYSYYDMHVSM